jgi:alcohol dehydrogenase class IV
MTTTVVSGQYNYIDQNTVLFGANAADALADHCTAHGAQRVLIVAAKSLSHGTGHITAISEKLGDRCIGMFDAVTAHAPLASVAELAARIRETSPDMIAVVGGGSAIDTTKAALIANVTGAVTVDEILAQADGNRRARGETDPIPAPPCRTVVVPTTLSGAEFGVIGGAVDPATQIKQGYRASWLCAETVIYDPQLSFDTPQWLWLSTGIRAVDHAVETVLSPDTNPYTDGLALEGLRLLGEGLRGSHADPAHAAARQKCQFGVWMASVGIGQVRYGASHGIGHQLGAVADVPHGYTSCVLLPAVLRYNQSVVGDRYGRITAALGETGSDAAGAVYRLIGDLGLPLSLTDLELSSDRFDEIAETSMHNHFVKANPRPIKAPADIRAILESAV